MTPIIYFCWYLFAMFMDIISASEKYNSYFDILGFVLQYFKQDTPLITELDNGHVMNVHEDSYYCGVVTQFHTCIACPCMQIWHHLTSPLYFTNAIYSICESV